MKRQAEIPTARPVPVLAHRLRRGRDDRERPAAARGQLRPRAGVPVRARPGARHPLHGGRARVPVLHRRRGAGSRGSSSPPASSARSGWSPSCSGRACSGAVVAAEMTATGFGADVPLGVPDPAQPVVGPHPVRSVPRHGRCGRSPDRDSPWSGWHPVPVVLGVGLVVLRHLPLRHPEAAHALVPARRLAHGRRGASSTCSRSCSSDGWPSGRSRSSWPASACPRCCCWRTSATAHRRSGRHARYRPARAPLA